MGRRRASLITPPPWWGRGRGRGTPPRQPDHPSPLVEGPRGRGCPRSSKLSTPPSNWQDKLAQTGSRVRVGTKTPAGAGQGKYLLVLVSLTILLTVNTATKLLAAMRHHPLDWRIDQLQAVARQHGIDWRQEGTSHCVFICADGRTLPVPAHRPIKPIYIKKFVALVQGAKP